jgi:anti-sigma factor (TIGR02949 family)
MTGFWKAKKRRVPHEPQSDIDCRRVLEQLYEYIDGELDDEMIGKIRRHLELCRCCYPHFDFESAFLRFLGDHGRVTAPPELRRKVFQAILEEESRG